MSNHLKILIFIGFVVGILWYVQNEYEIFEIKIGGQITENEQSEEVLDQEIDSVVIRNKDGLDVMVNVEIANTVETRTIGLSNRRYLGDYDGMLFIFDEDSTSPFWMKDCFINLDIIFVDSSLFIADIAHDQKPCSTDICPNIRSGMPYRYVLEVNGGFAKEHGIEIGQTIVLQYQD